MKYSLYKEVIPEYSALEQVLYNRGIPREKQEEWYNAETLYDWTYLGIDLMEEACAELMNTIDSNGNVCVIVDPDADGYTSAAILINYLFKRFEDWAIEHLSYVMHSGKQHGFVDVMDEILSMNPQLVIAPDSGSNDIEQHKILREEGIASICLDHHDYDTSYNETSPCIIVNIQGIPDYPNKSLTGAGVTFKFISAFEDLYVHGNHPDEFLDLCAVGNAGDMADLREPEIRALMNIGLKELKNPFLFQMASNNDYSIQKMNGLNYYSVAFYIVPFINAVVRSGTMEEKIAVFSGMITHTAFDKIETSKRGHKGELVPQYKESVLIAERVKRRQTKLQDEAMAHFDKRIKDENLLDNKILLLLCEPGEVDRNIAGLIANKLQAKYQKPTAILTLGEDGNYSGSMRNYSLSERNDLKQDLINTNEIVFCQGHASAAGLSIAANNVDNFLKAFNAEYADVEQIPTYHVDYIWNKNTIDAEKILDIGYFTIYGQEIPESKVVIEDICLDSSMVTLMGVDKGRPTLKIRIGNVDVIKFKSNEEEYEKFCQEDMVLTAVCKCQVNEWNGNISPQLIIEDYELREEMVF